MSCKKKSPALRPSSMSELAFGVGRPMNQHHFFPKQPEAHIRWMHDFTVCCLMLVETEIWIDLVLYYFSPMDAYTS